MEKIALPYYDKNGKRLMVPGMTNQGFEFDEDWRMHHGKLFGKKIMMTIKTLTAHHIINNQVINTKTESIKCGFELKIFEN
jgi:hypothetical protein